MELTLVCILLNLYSKFQNMPVFLLIPIITDKINSDTKKELRRIATEFFPQVSIFSNKFSIENLLRFKDQTPVDPSSKIVNFLKCSQCETIYEGDSTCHVYICVADRKGVSSRSNMPLSQP